MYYT